MTALPAQLQLPLEEVLPDIFFLHGSIPMGPGVRINRNMVVVRTDGELTLINPVRMENDADLEALGEVKHLVRLGFAHRVDDAYYLDKYGAAYWDLERVDAKGPTVDRVIRAGGETPFPDASFFVFDGPKQPECALLVERHGGVLVTCDAIQHHVAKTNVSLLGKAVMSVMGFMHPMNIGPPWLRLQTPKGGSLEGEFRRLAALDFKHGAGAHGQFCKDDAKKHLNATVKRVFG